MNKRNTPIRYDNKLLEKYCNENKITLLQDYNNENVKRETIINAKCLNCHDNSNKKFSQFIKSGCFCKFHTEKNKQEKRKTTCLSKYGCEFSQQNKEVKEKMKATNLEKYGCEHVLQNKEIKEKIKATNLEKFGCIYPSQNKEIKEKVKASNLEKFGCENALQNKEVREKGKATNLQKYGCEYAQQNKEVKEKIKATNLEKYGCEYPQQNKEIKEKSKESCFKNFGCEHPQQNKEVREKGKATCLEKYGCIHPFQNAEISEKASKNAYKSYDYTFPSGRIERIQGYENYMLNDLLKAGNLEEDIVVNRSEVPEVWYKDTSGKERRYFVDCFIKSQNRCIEAKSTWTAEKKQDCIYLKQQALKDAGYKCEIWVYDGKGEMVEKIL